jgi:hypothetical protein
VKKHSSYRISDDGKQLLKMIARDLGISETAVLEISVREFAEKKGVKRELYQSIQEQENHRNLSTVE